MDKLNKKMMRQSLSILSFSLFLLIFFIASAMFIASPVVLNSIMQQEGQITLLNIIFVIGVILAGHILTIGVTFFQTALKRNYFVKAISKLYGYIFDISYDKYIDEGPSALQNKTHEAVSAYTSFYFDTIPSLIINSLVVCASVVVAFTVNPFVAILMFATLPFNYIGYKLLNKKLSVLSVEMNKICSTAWANENTLISQVDFIKQNPQNELLLPFIERFRFSSQNITRKVNNTAMGISKAFTAINQIINNLLILILAFMMLNDTGAIGGAVFIMLVLPYFTESVSGLVRVNLSFAGINAANTFLEDVESNRESTGSRTIEKIDTINFDVKEVVVKDKVLLTNIHFAAKRGDIIGIMGGSGLGKSTLLKMLMKFRTADGIFVDGVPISEIDNTSYRMLVSYYSQNTPIITDTLYNNLNFGRVPVTTSNYKELKFLEKFENYDEVILENGANLSAGDKQRISLARFFTENADVVIFDEPTSSLDKDTENEILSSVLNNCKDKIVFLVSHDKQALHGCTQLYEIRDKNLIKITPST